jgi:type II secretory pathway pseudopilin PulG
MKDIEQNPGQAPISPDHQRLENRGFFRRPPTRQSGFTFLGLLIIIAIMGAGLAAAGGLYSHTAQRDKERELLFVGNQFRAAIESYYRRSPGAAAFPKSLDELVEDKRFPMPQHHLRRIYADPLTGKPDWAVVEAPGGAGIMGVHSRSDAAPVKTGNFDARDAAFEGAVRYSDWPFVYQPPEPPAPKG